MGAKNAPIPRESPAGEYELQENAKRHPEKEERPAERRDRTTG